MAQQAPMKWQEHRPLPVPDWYVQSLAQALRDLPPVRPVVFSGTAGR